MKDILYIDMMAFPTRQMTPPIFATDFPRPAIVQYTAAPPLPSITTTEGIIAEVRSTVLALEAQEGVTIVRSADVLQESITGIKVILGLQQPPLDATEAGMAALKKLGIQLTTLAYKGESPYGGGFLSKKLLTITGIHFIEMLRNIGIWIDLAHAGHETARNVLALLKQDPHPVLATHTGCYGVYDNPRNLPDDVLENIAYHRGIIGLYALTFGLDPKDNSLAPFVRHLRHLIKVCGMDSIALGTDSIYRQLSDDELLAQFEAMKRFDPDGAMRSRHPVVPPELNCIGKDQVLIQFLRDHMGQNDGFCFTNLLYANVLRFLRDNL